MISLSKQVKKPKLFIKVTPTNIIQKSIFTFVKTSENSVFAVHDNRQGSKLLTCLRLNFSPLNKHKFRHNFIDAINPMYNCGSELENTAHFLLRYQNHKIIRSKLLRNVYNLDQTLQNYDVNPLTHIVPMLHFCTPWKRQKTKGFLMFSGGTEM